MNYFSKKSRERLDTCHPDLQLIMGKALEIYDFTVIEGHRSNERQDELFKKGASQLEGGQSKHNSTPSMAVDIAPYPIDWNDAKRFYFLAGIVLSVASDLGIKVRWGGDWDCDFDFKDNSFDDLAHFELTN